jgi:gluconolactonase
MRSLCLLALAIACATPAAVASIGEQPFSITRAAPELDAVIAPDAHLELLGDRFGITEGPVWVPDGGGGYVLVSDLTANVIYRIAPDKTVSVFLERAGYSGSHMEEAGIQSHSGRMAVLLIGPSCTALDALGRLLWCADNDGAIMRLEKDGRRSVVVDKFQGKRFNGPNDLVLTHAGAMFFTDPDFGLRYGAQSPLKQLDSAGVWYLENGRLRKVLDERQLGGPPDGIALSPDEHFLYLSAGLGRIKRYTVAPDGQLSGGVVFAEGPGIGDGIKVDLAGNVYSASGTAPGIVRITAPSGKLLGTLNLPIPAAEPKRYICASNLAFGGPDGRTLIITACQAVYRIQLRAAGPVGRIATSSIREPITDPSAISVAICAWCSPAPSSSPDTIGERMLPQRPAPVTNPTPVARTCTGNDRVMSA